MVSTNAVYTIRNNELYRSTSNHDFYIVLAENKKTGMWVTWDCTNGTIFYWGHYYDRKVDAVRDYHIRLAEINDLPWEV